MEAQQAYVSLENGDLVVIDVGLCTSRSIGKTSIPMYDIAIGPDGVMYGIGKDNILYRIDSANAASMPIGYLNPMPGDDFNSLVFSTTGILYAATNISTILYTIDITNAQTKALGDIGYKAAGDLTFFEGVLYMAARNNFLIRVNATDPKQSVPVGKMPSESNIFGVVTIGSIDCKGGRPQMYALGGNQIYAVSPVNATTRRICSNLNLSSAIYGAASGLEATPQTRANAGRDTSVFFCENTRQIRLNLLVGPKDSAGTWYGPANAALSTDPIVDISNLTPGTYRYFHTAGEGNCADTASVNLNVDRLTPVFPHDTALCQGKTLRIELSDSAATYRWQDGTTASQYTISKPGSYSVQVTKNCGRTEVSVEVKYENCGGCLVSMPDAFSPNGDGRNDFYGIISACQFASFALRIYNRWGEVVFQSNEPALLWDGRCGGQYVPPGVYAYQLNYLPLSDPAHPYTRSGQVLLIR